MLRMKSLRYIGKDCLLLLAWCMPSSSWSPVLQGWGGPKRDAWIWFRRFAPNTGTIFWAIQITCVWACIQAIRGSISNNWNIQLYVDGLMETTLLKTFYENTYYKKLKKKETKCLLFLRYRTIMPAAADIVMLYSFLRILPLFGSLALALWLAHWRHSPTCACAITKWCRSRLHARTIYNNAP